jgi:hypothetical protein
MQAPVEICYAGVVVARAQEVREVDGSAFFIVMKEPLPVGTVVDVRSNDSLTTLRVAHVVESADGVDNGMHVRPVGADDSTRWIPPPPAKPASQPIVQVVAPVVNVAPPAEAAPAPEQVAAVVVEPVPEKVAAVLTEAVAPAPAESAAVPVSVPVESSGKRRKKSTAVQMVIAETSAPVPVPEPSPVAVAAPDSNGTPEKAADGEAENSVAASAEFSGEVVEPVDGDLPPARPIQGANGRRRTKRRR